MNKPHTEKYTCPQCGKTYKYKKSYERHLEECGVSSHIEQQNTVSEYRGEGENQSFDEIHDRDVKEYVEIEEQLQNEKDSIGIDELFSENSLNEIYPIHPSEQTSFTHTDVVGESESEAEGYNIVFDVDFFIAINDMLNNALKTDLFQITPSQKRTLRKILSNMGYTVDNPQSALIIMIAIIYIPPIVILAIERGWFEKFIDKFGGRRGHNVNNDNWQDRER